MPGNWKRLENLMTETLFDYRVRDRDPRTSWDAAKIRRSDAEGVRQHVLAIIRDLGPVGDEAIFSAYRAQGGTRTAQRVRTARAELCHPGAGERPLVAAQGTTTSATGRTAQLWVAVDGAGRATPVPRLSRGDTGARHAGTPAHGPRECPEHPYVPQPCFVCAREKLEGGGLF